MAFHVSALPTSCFLVSLFAKFVYDRLPEKKIIDKYPESLRPTVEKIRTLITEDIYTTLTSRKSAVMIFPRVEGWVVKGTSNKEIILDFVEWMFDGIAWDNDYKVTNSEGAVYRPNFNLAGRVHTAKKLRQIIKTHHLQMIRVPKKYYCSYPSAVVPSTNIFYNERYFVLAEKCATQECGNKTKSTFRALSASAKKQLSQELILFLRESGIVDFHLWNFYIKDQKLVLFDTEPMALTLASRMVCISPALKESRVNYENVKRVFADVHEAKEIVHECDKAIRTVRLKEFTLFIQTVTLIAMVILGLVSLRFEG